MDLAKLKTLCQQGAESRSAIETATAERLDFLDKEVEGPPSREILSKLLRGDFGDPSNATKTAYTLEVVISWLGEMLPTVFLRPAEHIMAVTDEWHEVLDLPLPLFKLTSGEFEPPVGLHPPKGFPHIVTFSADEVAESHRRAEEVVYAEQGPLWERFHGLCAEFRRLLPDHKRLDELLNIYAYQGHANPQMLEDTVERFVSYYPANNSDFQMLPKSTQDSVVASDIESEVEQNLPVSGVQKDKAMMESVHGICDWTKRAALAKNAIVCFVY